MGQNSWSEGRGVSRHESPASCLGSLCLPPASPHSPAGHPQAAFGGLDSKRLESAWKGGWGLQKAETETFRKPAERGCLELPGMLGTIPGVHITWKSGSHSPSCQGGEEILRWGVGSVSWNNSPSPLFPSPPYTSTPLSQCTASSQTAKRPPPMADSLSLSLSLIGTAAI